MSPDIFAILTLCAYGLVFVGILIWQVRRFWPGWITWALHSASRIYIPFCFHLRLNRPCPFPVDSPALIIANHRSPVDPIYVWIRHPEPRVREEFRPINFMTAREYCETPGLKWLFRAVECIPVDRNQRDMAATREALRRLKEGRLIAVFPEGKINTGPGLLPGNPGIAWLALTAEVPVYPVFIHNSPQGRNMIEPFYTFQRVTVSYGDPIDLSPYFSRRKTHEVLTEVTDLLMARLAETGRLEVQQEETPVSKPSLRVASR